MHAACSIASSRSSSCMQISVVTRVLRICFSGSIIGREGDVVVVVVVDVCGTADRWI
jgi:hypothetical protein